MKRFQRQYGVLAAASVGVCLYAVAGGSDCAFGVLSPALPGVSATDASNADDAEWEAEPWPMVLATDGAQRLLPRERVAIRHLPTLGRLVRHFDFEEAAEAPYEMPIYFYRYGTDEAGIAEGFPPFGTMRLTNETAYSGDWSFGFSLDGGSMAARVPTAVIPVVPLADYVVTTRIKTRDLRHARARLSAWLYDGRGEKIATSRVDSEPVHTDGQWQTLAVRVRGEYEHAADLAIELQLLQPEKFTQEPRDPHQIMPEDVRGRAWFDDVSVWHLPRIELDTGQPGNLIRADGDPAVTVLIRDLAHEKLETRLRIFDVDGRLLLDDTFPAPRAPRPRTIGLPLEKAGWYRAVLDVEREGEVVARRWIDLAMLPESRRRHLRWDNRFAVALHERWYERLENVVTMIDSLGLGRVLLPVLDRSMTLETAGEIYARYEGVLERLLLRHHEIVFVISSIPRELASSLDITPDEVLVPLERDPELWREYLDALIVNFGLEVPNWQIGGLTAPEVLWHGETGAAAQRARDALKGFVPRPWVSLIAAADHEMVNADFVPGGETSLNIVMPHELEPTTLGRQVASWADSHEDLTVTLMLPEQGQYSPRRGVADMAFRTLHAWRGGASLIAIEPPWHWGSNQRSMPMPTPIYPAWRQLAEQLNGRRFAGEMSLGPHVNCWILEGVSPGDAALVAWTDEDLPPGSREFALQLSGDPVDMIDIWGNVETIPLRDREHTIALGGMPVFIEGIDLALALFRGGFALEPDFIPAEHRVHEHELILRNPWSTPISGTLHLHESGEWRTVPRSIDFAIRANSTIRLPVSIIFDRGIVAGPKRLYADVVLHADHEYELTVFTDFEVGLEDIEISTTWMVARNAETGRDDLIITLYISNTGQRVLNLDAFMLAREVRQQRRLISGLEPGEMSIRHFRIPDGADQLSGQTVRVGISERGGNARLNQWIEVPELGGTEAP